MFKPHSHQKGRAVPPKTPLPETTETIAETQSENLSADVAGFSATDEQPKKRRGRQPGQAKQTETLSKIRTTLEMIFGTGSTLLMAAGGKATTDGMLIRAHSPALIDSILVLCQQDKNVREFFLSLSTGTAYANVVIASLPIVIGILANHNLIPPIFGTPAPVTSDMNGAAIPNGN